MFRWTWVLLTITFYWRDLGQVFKSLGGSVSSPVRWKYSFNSAQVRSCGPSVIPSFFLYPPPGQQIFMCVRVCIMLFWLLYPCCIVWNQVVWYSGTLVLVLVFQKILKFKKHFFCLLLSEMPSPFTLHPILLLLV